MQTLDIEKFNPTVAELNALATQYRNLAIAGVEDKEGYERVHKARMELVRTRGDITRAGKALRDDANKFSKAVIEKEKELVGIIEPVEKDLKAKQEAIDEEKERARRVVLLPDRRAKLAEIGEIVSDDDLLGMSVEDFSVFFNSRKELYLERKEATLRAEEQRMAEEKRLVEEAKLAEQHAKEREAELEQARKEATEKAEREAVVRAEQEAKAKAEREAEEQAKLEKNKKYKAFLDKHGVTADNQASGEFFVAKSQDGFVLYQRVASIKI